MTVGRVRCDQHGIAIEPTEIRLKALKPIDTRRLRAKLERLVASVTGDPFDGLLALRSDLWSFVEVACCGGHSRSRAHFHGAVA